MNNIFKKYGFDFSDCKTRTEIRNKRDAYIHQIEKESEEFKQELDRVHNIRKGYIDQIGDIFKNGNINEDDYNKAMDLLGKIKETPYPNWNR